MSSASVFEADAPTESCNIHTVDSVVRLCKDCPILNEDGTETGMYHIAGDYCPEESILEVCLPNYERAPIGTAVSLDEMYRKSVVEGYGPCTVHTQPTIVDPPWYLDPTSPWYPGTGEPGGEIFRDPEDPDAPEQNVPSQDVPSQDVRPW